MTVYESIDYLLYRPGPHYSGDDRVLVDAGQYLMDGPLEFDWEREIQQDSIIGGMWASEVPHGGIAIPLRFSVLHAFQTREQADSYGRLAEQYGRAHPQGTLYHRYALDDRGVYTREDIYIATIRRVRALPMMSDYSLGLTSGQIADLVLPHQAWRVIDWDISLTQPNI